MKKKLLCILFVLCMALNMLPATAMASSQYYIDENGDSQSLSEFTLVNSSTTEWTDGWYLVYGAVTISGGVTVNGNVCLVLMDSCHLMVTTPTVSSSDGTPRAGINVPAGSSLTIYGQTGGSGRLSATGSEVKDISGGGGAGIGGNGSFSDQAAGENCGAVTICGGVITATGKSGGAGIGGGAGYHSVGVNTNTTKGGNGGVVKIFGGDVTATGNNGGAGIGGGAGGFSDGYSSIKGAEGGSGGEVSIYGGIVKATGKYGAGIGGGQGGIVM